MNTNNRRAILEMSCRVDLELALVDCAIAREIYKRRREQAPVPRRPRRPRPRAFWCRHWYLERPQRGQFRLLMDDLMVQDESSFRNFTRMDPETFYSILARIAPHITKQDTFWREAISPDHRLAVTLRYYASGDCYQSMHFNWYMSANTIGKIVREVTEAIIEEFAAEQLNCPTTTEGWRAVADKFASRWNYHHCLGALDGKHVAIKKPPNSGSLNFNYKHFFSIVLMAMVDADYRFLWIDVGAAGSNSDAQIWNDCELKELMEEDALGVPPDEPLPGDNVPLPYFIVGDDAFGLRTFLMKPYGRTRRNLTKAERIFNYRTSRARRIVENAFGILCNRWGCMGTTMRQRPETIRAIVIACCILHNMLRSQRIPRGLLDEEDANHQVIPGAWREGDVLLDGIGGGRGNRATNRAKQVREHLTEYYESPEGQVPWQDNMI